MLMECLSAGRAISLPSSSTAGAKTMLRFSTAYGRIRKQFGLPVARMEGSRGATGANIGKRLRPRSGPGGNFIHGLSRREAVGDFGADEIPVDRTPAPGRQRCHGFARRPRHLRRAVELPAVGLSDGAGRDHGRGREHPDAVADHVCARCACARILICSRNPGGAIRSTRPKGLAAFDEAFVGPCWICRVQCLRRAVPQPDRPGMFAQAAIERRPAPAQFYRQLVDARAATLPWWRT